MFLKVTGEPAMAPPPSPRRIPFSIYRSLLIPHRWVNIEFLIRLVLVAKRMVVGNGKTEVFRRTSTVSHGGRRPESKKKAEPPLCEAGSDVNRSILNLRPRLEDTPSRGKLLKEPLDLLIINPPSIASN
jgi:hypothetical protein